MFTKLLYLKLCRCLHLFVSRCWQINVLLAMVHRNIVKSVVVFFGITLRGLKAVFLHTLEKVGVTRFSQNLVIINLLYIFI